MADSKITALTALTAADPVNDMFPVVDVSDTTMAASGTTKKISVNNILGASGTATLASATITGSATVGTTLLVGTNATLTNGNLILGTSGKGIDFSATANSSGTMTSELLADYEEGTWVGTLKGSITDPTVAVTVNGKYTKIGRQVSIQIAFEVVSNVGALGDVFISGVPFVNTSGIRTIGTGGVYAGGTFTGTLISTVGASGSIIDFQAVVSNAAWGSLAHNPGTGRYFWANITYTV